MVLIIRIISEIHNRTGVAVPLSRIHLSTKKAAPKGCLFRIPGDSCQSITVVFGLVRAGNRNSDVVGLFL